MHSDCGVAWKRLKNRPDRDRIWEPSNAVVWRCRWCPVPEIAGPTKISASHLATVPNSRSPYLDAPRRDEYMLRGVTGVRVAQPYKSWRFSNVIRSRIFFFEIDTKPHLPFKRKTKFLDIRFRVGPEWKFQEPIYVQASKCWYLSIYIFSSKKKKAGNEFIYISPWFPWYVCTLEVRRWASRDKEED
jgi:hypothetical protein